MSKSDMLSYLLDNFGGPEQATKVSDKEISKYFDKVPETILKFWRDHGRGSYLNGFFWFCDPALLQPILRTLFEGDPEYNAEDMTTVGYSAFGSLEVWDKTRRIIGIDFLTSTIYSPPDEYYLDLSTGERLDDNILVQTPMTSFINSDRDDFDEALATLGKLEPGEIYGYAPVLQLGGSQDVEHLHRTKIVEHLAMICGLSRFNLTRLTPPDPPAFPFGRLEVIRPVGPLTRQ
ncbi:DUF1851 domain-containing protein [Labrys sp. LIt4]|uniref:GAD-like domain-containing protein n=1 Tax=Labrys sp. LIt4 TaxID=2821355 RepID=UPI001AE00F2C|nr:GAD-like domain-containing protein [Labrys sp. LIt4]MBP0583234.1 DUF1851 domain-containing protein [Labrys sp. LIt4]